METGHNGEYDVWREDPLTIGPQGGEFGIQGTNRLLISSLLGFDARGYRDRLDQSPGALNILDFTSDVRARLRLLNDSSHYEDVPVRTYQ